MDSTQQYESVVKMSQSLMHSWLLSTLSMVHKAEPALDTRGVGVQRGRGSVRGKQAVSDQDHRVHS